MDSDAAGKEVVVGGGLVAARPGDLDHQAHTPWSPEDVDRALWEMAVAGGNVSRAHLSLSDWCDAQEPPVACPSRRTMAHWKKGPYRNRYHEICASRARDLDEVLAQQHVEIALRSAELERDAMAKIAERMASVDAVEASLILRNVSSAKKNAVDGAQGLRGRSAGHVAAASVAQLVDKLARLGVVTVEEVTDAEAVEIAADAGA